MSSETLYEVQFQPWDHSWCLSGPVGANGGLLFGSAREAVSHARWEAKADGGVISVYDAEGQLFKSIEIAPEVSNGDPVILPSCEDHSRENE